MLQGKKALVTGASDGIGRAIAVALAQEGADVVITYFTNEAEATETATTIETCGRRVLLSRVNLAYADEIDRLFDDISLHFGQLDIFVSNAALTNVKPLADLVDRHWEYIMRVNVDAFLLCSLRALRMMEGRGGRIIGISSLGSRLCLPGYAALGVAKAAIEALARYMAVEWADKGINVNVVCAGPVDTPALDAFKGLGLDMKTFKAELADRAPEKRLGQPADLARTVVFLCGPQADWIRGQTIVVDGGYSLTW